MPGYDSCYLDRTDFFGGDIKKFQPKSQDKADCYLACRITPQCTVRYKSWFHFLVTSCISLALLVSYQLSLKFNDFHNFYVAIYDICITGHSLLQAFSLHKFNNKCWLKKSGYEALPDSHIISGKMECFRKLETEGW